MHLDFFSEILSPPIFKDDYRGIVAKFLNAILVTVICLTFTLLIYRLATGGKSLDTTERTLAGVVVFNFMLLIVLRRGYALQSGVALVLSTWAAITYQVWNADGVYDVAVVAYIIIIVMTSVLTNWRVEVVITAASILSVWGMAIYHPNSRMISGVDTPTNFARDLTVFFILAGAFTFFLVRALNESMERMEKEFNNRIRAEQALHERDEIFRKIFHVSPVAIILTTLKKGILIEANNAYWNLMGFDPKEALGKTTVELGLWDSETDRQQFIRRILEQRSLTNPSDELVNGKGQRLITAAFHEMIDSADEPNVLSMYYNMTDQVIAQEALKQSESRTRALLATIPDMIFELSRDGTFLDFIPSQTLTPLLPPEQFVGNNVAEVMLPEVAEIALRTVEQALTDSEVHAFEYQLPSRNGHRDFEARMVICRPNTVLAIIRDITGRKSTEQALRDSQQLLRAVMDNIPQSIFWKDSQLTFMGCNRAFADDVGLASPNDIIGKTDWDLPSKHAELYRADDIRVMKSGTPKLNYEEPLTKPDGSTSWLSTSKVPMRDESGNIYGVLGMYGDITGRKRTEQALYDSEQKFRNFIGQSSEGFALVDENGLMLEWNQAQELISGLSRETVLGMNVWDVQLQMTVPERRTIASHERIKAITLEILRSGQVPLIMQNIEVEVCQPNGQQIKVQQSMFPIRMERGYCLGSITRDITRRKQAEQEREVMIQELQSKNAELEQFTYTVSHDLKSPLITIRGFLGFIEQDAKSGNIARLKVDIQRVSDATNKMQRLLSELLELSRIGRLTNPSEMIPFEELARTALDTVDGQLSARGVVTTLQPNLPAAYGDRQRLGEVLQNLLDNAAKFMGDQPDPRIEIGQYGEENGNPIFFVKDNGIGIAPEYHEKVFHLFDKLDPKIEGTGVGLALVKRIIEFHGGRIWIESETGKGSTFCFVLPAR